MGETAVSLYLLRSPTLMTSFSLEVGDEVFADND